MALAPDAAPRRSVRASEHVLCQEFITCSLRERVRIIRLQWGVPTDFSGGRLPLCAPLADIFMVAAVRIFPYTCRSPEDIPIAQGEIDADLAGKYLQSPACGRFLTGVNWRPRFGNNGITEQSLAQSAKNRASNNRIVTDVLGASRPGEYRRLDPGASAPNRRRDHGRTAEIGVMAWQPFNWAGRVPSDRTDRDSGLGRGTRCRGAGRSCGGKVYPRRVRRSDVSCVGRCCPTRSSQRSYAIPRSADFDVPGHAPRRRSPRRSTKA